jgi:ketosteroid isomerase-like protein
MKFFVSLILICISVYAKSQTGDEAQIRNLLSVQESNWNKGDIPAFMDAYWKNDSLRFIGNNGITYGWNNTLANYKKSYPDSATMGKLTFTLLHLKPISSEYFHVIGRWKLDRARGNAQGYFTLLFRKIAGSWLIVADHSS